MDRITRAQARLNLMELHVPPLALSIFDGDPLPDNLDIHFCTPYYVLDSCEDQQEYYGKGRITPLWGEGSYMVTVYHHDLNGPGWFRFDIERPQEALTPVRLSWNQMLVEPFVSMIENESYPVDYLVKLAGLLAFDHLDRLMLGITERNRGPYESFEKWEEAFKRSIA